jgi:3-oxoacyl-[acyl-carrier protein] reductase
VSLAERIALVTGAGRGIGRAVAIELAQAGATVVVNDVDSEPALEVATQIEEFGGGASTYVASVLDYEASRSMVEHIVDEHGRIDILVNNAGVASSGKSILRTPVDEAERLMALNAFGALIICQAALPTMRQFEFGDIIMISSAAVEYTPSHGGAYNMAKAAMEALAFTLAKEERGRGIRVNVVAPTMTDTRLGREIQARIVTSGSATGGPHADQLQAMAAPRAVADAVMALVCDPDRQLTGRKVTVGGTG